MKNLSNLKTIALAIAILLAQMTNAQIVLHDAANVTQTKAVLSAEFPDSGFVAKGFEYKFGTVPILDEFSKFVLSQDSEPVQITTTGKQWSARTVKGWVESNKELAAGESSSMTATVTFYNAGKVSFDWSVDSEENIGVLCFIVDGEVVSEISGFVDFKTYTRSLAAGEHTLEWIYEKKSATNVGLDLGMVRNIKFVNVTEGDWIEVQTDDDTYELSNLYPGHEYIYRAYYTRKKEGLIPSTVSRYMSVYSQIETFSTLPVTLGEPEIVSTTQTTATISCSVNLGDAHRISQCGIITNGKIRPSLSGIDAALLFPGSDPVDISHSGGLGISFYQMSPGDAYYSDRGVWIKADGYYVQADFTLYEDAVISFTCSAVNSGFLKLYIDNVLVEELYRESKSVSELLGKGKHTIKWLFNSSFDSGYARLYDLNITKVDVSKLKNYNIPYNPQLPTDTILLEATSTLCHTMAGLPTLSKSNATFFVELSVDNQSEVLLSDRIDFETKPVTADTLDVESIRQASATIRGKVDGGDATVIATGLQYKDISGTRWTNFTKEINDTLLSHTITRLRPSTTYNYRSYIQSQGCDTVYSEVGTFTTLSVEAKKPVLINRTQRTAEIQGKVIFGDASIYQRGMQFRKQGTEEWEEVEDGGNDSIYILKKSGLEIKSNYQARTYIQPAGSDIIYSDILDFRTKSVEVYIDSITDVYQRNVTVHGKIDCVDEPLSGGRISIYRVIEGQMSDFVKSVDIPTNDSLFVQKITGLQPNTAYCFIAELDYGEGQKAYSNVHENETLEGDAYKKALLANGSSTNVEIEYADGWEATENGLYFGQYAWKDDLTVTFTLTKETTISFDWSVVRSYSYNGATSPSIRLFIDGSSIAFKQISAILNDKTYSAHVTITLDAGKHTLTWSPDYTGRFYVKNLMIPVDEESAAITTRGFFKDETIIATDVTQTRAFLIATLEETDEDIEGYEFRYNITDVLNLNQGENDEKVVKISVEKGENGNLSQSISGLLPSQNYNYAVVAKLDGQLFASPIKVFETLPVNVQINVNSITQTSATATVKMSAGDADIQNLQYFVSGTDMDGYKNVDGAISITGLKPMNTYNIYIRWNVSGKEYSYSSSFKTSATSVTRFVEETTQTSAVVQINPNYGTATYINSGFIFANDSVVNVPLGETVRLTELEPNTSYTIQPFLETLEGGLVYGSTLVFMTKAISLITEPVSNISNRSATMNGTIDCDSYSSAEFGFQWKQMSGWESEPAFTKGVKNDDGTISVALVNGMLEPNTDYQYRVAVRYLGKVYSASDWVTFRTELEYVYYPASVYTIFRTDRENNALVLCGYYVAGSESISSQGYEYWSITRQTRSAGEVVTINTDESMQYSISLASLADGNYSVRAFVETASGDRIYGQTLSFGVSGGALLAVDEMETDNIECSVSGNVLSVHNAANQSCIIYNIQGAIIEERDTMSDTETFVLERKGLYIVSFSNGVVRKVRL